MPLKCGHAQPVGEYHTPRNNYTYQGESLTLVQMQQKGFELYGKENPPQAIFRQYTFQASNNNFALISGSPAIGMAKNLQVETLSVDIDGKQRGLLWDVGCYCYTGVMPGWIYKEVLESCAHVLRRN